MPSGRRKPLARAMREVSQIKIERDDVETPVDFEEALARVETPFEEGRLSRRDLLKVGGAIGAAALLAACTPGSSGSSPFGKPQPPVASGRPTPHDPRIVVVGAGLAGTTAAYRLRQAGLTNVQLYESRDRVGGRCWTAREFEQMQTAEHGGEFIDTRHVHIRRLAKELGLPLEDLWEGWLRGSTYPAWIDGQLRAWETIHTKNEEITKKAIAAAKRIGCLPEGGKFTDAPISHGTATPAAIEMDQLSMAEWLDQQAPGVIGTWHAHYLDEAMNGWYGLEMDRLSALNWIDFFVTPVTGGDERWHIKGGNDLVPNTVAAKLPAGTSHLKTALQAMRKKGDGTYELRFSGVAQPVVADFVIMTIPFTTLRKVDLSDTGFSDERMKAINELGMGADVKLLLQYDKRPQTFRAAGGPWSGGLEYSPPAYDTWESGVLEPATTGLITVYAGGRTGESWVGEKGPHDWAPVDLTTTTVDQIDQVAPGTAGHFNGRAWLDAWVQDPWVGGSYAAFTPGQMTRFWHYTPGAEGNVHFGGEHTSTYSQGFLNGGVESGDRTAKEVIQAIGLPLPETLKGLPYSTAASS